MADASSSQLKMADKYIRLMVFVVDVCTKSLRDLFVSIVKTDPNQYESIEEFMQVRKSDILQKNYKPGKNILESMIQAKDAVDIEKLDISLLAFLLKELFPEILHENEIFCINDILLIRNFLVHMPSIDSLSNQTFDETWKRLMNAVLTLNKRSGETTSEDEVTDRLTTIVETNKTLQDLEKSFRVQERLENMTEEVTKRLDYRTIEVEKMTEEGIKLLYDRKDEVEKMTEEGIKRLDDRKDEVEKMTEEGIKRLYDKIDEVGKMTEGIKRLYDRKDEGVRKLEYMTEDVERKLAIITTEGIERFYDMKDEVTKSLEYKADEVQDRLNAMATEVQDRQKATTAEVKERVEFKADEVIKRLEYQAEKVLERFKYMPREESKSKKDATAHTDIERMTEQTVKVPKVKRRIAAEKQESIESKSKKDATAHTDIKRMTEQTVKVPKVKRRIAEEKQESIGDDNADFDPFLCTGNVKKIERLIKLEKLPDQRTLDEMCRVHGRKSKVIMVTCEKICENIKSKHASIEYVWAAYTLQDEGKLTFVITVKETSQKRLRPLRLEKLIKYSFVKQYVGEFSLEGSEVIKEIKRQASSSARLDKESYQHIQTCISKHSEDLMKEHKYLSIISACSNRSRGFGASWEVLPENCIVLYVQKKNYIPIDEEPFETRYDSIPVDVREGVFIPYGHTARYGNTAREKLDPVRMGCQIGGDSFRGTLGCFIDHPVFGVCGLTCAHVVLSSVELLHLKSLNGGIMNWPLHGMSKDVYQPGDKQSVLGNNVQLIYREGSSNTCGMDVALFRITDRKPKTANFPDASVISGSRIQPINYDSWRMCSPGRLDLNMDHVVKFGSATELREGKIKFGASGVKVLESWAKISGCATITLFNQIEVENHINDLPFANHGDSGALVFVVENNSQHTCIGIVEGGTTHGTVVVTPIVPILEELNVPGLKSFEAETHLSYINDNLEAKINTVGSDVKGIKDDIRMVIELLNSRP